MGEGQDVVDAVIDRVIEYGQEQMRASHELNQQPLSSAARRASVHYGRQSEIVDEIRELLRSAFSKEEKTATRVILFLDIDGVLNSTRYWEANKPLPMGKAGAIDPQAVKIVNEIVSILGATVILSSSWRGNGSQTDEVERMIRERGGTFPLSGYTPILNGDDRWPEIESWLATNINEWDTFIVLDDDPTSWNASMRYTDRGLHLPTNYIDGVHSLHIDTVKLWKDGWG